MVAEDLLNAHNEERLLIDTNNRKIVDLTKELDLQKNEIDVTIEKNLALESQLNELQDQIESLDKEKNELEKILANNKRPRSNSFGGLENIVSNGMEWSQDPLAKSELIRLIKDSVSEVLSAESAKLNVDSANLNNEVLNS